MATDLNRLNCESGCSYIYPSFRKLLLHRTQDWGVWANSLFKRNKISLTEELLPYPSVPIFRIGILSFMKIQAIFLFTLTFQWHCIMNEVEKRYHFINSLYSIWHHIIANCGKTWSYFLNRGKVTCYPLYRNNGVSTMSSKQDILS